MIPFKIRTKQDLEYSVTDHWRHLRKKEITLVGFSPRKKEGKTNSVPFEKAIKICGKDLENKERLQA